MHTVGIYLIYAAVVVRGVVRLDRMQQPGLVLALLGLYGMLLLVETRTMPGWHRRRGRHDDTAPDATVPWPVPASLLLQAALVVGLLLNREVQDFYAMLFIPPSLQAVFSFGTRAGFAWIAAFALAMAGPLVASQEGWTFGAVMVANYGGICILIGGYAHQVRVADAARRESRRTLGDLQVAHRQLQGDAAQREELAVEQERNRLARDLHDSVTQTVFSMNLTVQSARLLLHRDRSQAAGQLDRLEELAASAMRQIQALVSQLRPMPITPLAAEGLPAALCRLAAERRTHDGLEVAVEVAGERALAAPVAADLYAIAQEALTNVARHAGTQHATIRVSLAEGASFLEVEDAGVGFDPQVPGSGHGHLGLASMAERAHELGWTLSIDSHPGCGTRIRVAEAAGGGQE